MGFDGAAHTGEMVVHQKYAAAVADVFHRLYDARWPIRRMRLVDDYGGNDERSMAANNTSGYNCRRVAGRDAWSAHAYGAAIDINPVQNPYLTRSSIHPPGAERFTTIDRSATPASPAARSGTETSWCAPSPGSAGTGAVSWPGPKDYQHFTALTR